MASKPGPLTQWPWEKLGNFKYVLLLPLATKAVHTNILGGEEEDNCSLMILLLVAARFFHNQLWISISRFQNGRSKRQIQSRGIQFEQVDREGTWDDNILLHALLLSAAHAYMPGATNFPHWNTKGLIVVIVAHVGPAEFIYYWAHRALHHHFLYTRYHSHHHSSFVTEPITSVVHPFAEHLLYVVIFMIPLIATLFTKSVSLFVVSGYVLWFDWMNNMGHCNFEFVPAWTFRIFPLLKYLMYTPSFHSLHHSQVHTNFSLFMPLYDHLYGTLDKSSYSLHQASWKGRKETVDFVYLTHATSLLSLFHLRLGFASFASRPYSAKWYTWILWPMSVVMMTFLRLFGRTFSAEKNKLNGLNTQTWIIPRYTFQYFLASEIPRINSLIEHAILEAEKKGAKVICLGLLNQLEDLNGAGELYVKRQKNLKIRIVDGSTLAAAVVVNAVGATDVREVFLCGASSKLGCLIVRSLCESGVRIQLLVGSTEEWNKIIMDIPSQIRHNIVHTSSYQDCNNCKVWVVGRWLSEQDQMKAPRGTHFVPFLPFPIHKARKDCVYYSTPAMRVPSNLENVHSCENWLERRVMSAWRVGGMVHALEGWEECETQDVNEVWEAALKHGFLPISNPSFDKL